ncbi:hypothetical protein SH661x_004545 [Planctomicrobium sp. SH661]|uniref:hypothetical protein n=1 Tax=Planctomicrobium sp. SH661 TaxID=3448124 RepID=UPI003F5C2CFA
MNEQTNDNSDLVTAQKAILKSRPNHQEYLRVLEAMGPEARAAKSFELSDLTKRVFREGLRDRFPDLPEVEFHQLFLDRLAKCHNRNY